jgi:hypothetical protein
MTSVRSCVLGRVRRVLVFGLCVSYLACGRAAVSPSQGSESPTTVTEESETARESATATESETATQSETESETDSDTPCRVRSFFVEYDRENEPPSAPVRSEVVVERFVDDWFERDTCDRDFEDYAMRPMRCAPRARSRAEVRGDELAPNRVLVGTRDGESLHVVFDDRGRTRRVEWDPTASGSFDYAFEYEYDCVRR